MMPDSINLHVPLILRTTSKYFHFGHRCLFMFAVQQMLTNKRARLQYDLAQQPRLLQYLPGTMLDLLKTALDSHRRALDINQENTDLLL